MITIKVKLYHVTVMKNINSILDKGIIPGYGASPFEGIKPMYSNKGVYFSSTLPKQALDQDDIYYPESIGLLPVVIEVELNITAEQTLPDEEAIHPSLLGTHDGLSSYLKGDTVVILGEIEASSIKQIFYSNQPFIHNYITELCSSPLIKPYGTWQSR